MQHMVENQIRERAYQIWMANGCVDGQADGHWFAAEQEVTAAVTPTMPAAKTAKPSRRRSSAKAAR